MALTPAADKSAEKALEALIVAVCPFTDGYVPDAIRVLEAIWAVPNGIESLNKMQPVGPYLARRRREFE